MIFKLLQMLHKYCGPTFHQRMGAHNANSGHQMNYALGSCVIRDTDIATQLFSFQLPFQTKTNIFDTRAFLKALNII